MATVAIAPIAARAGNGGTNHDGVYKTASRPVPAGHYDSIIVFLTFNNEASDFLAGDVVHIGIDLSFDGGQTWGDTLETDCVEGQPSPHNGLYYISWADITIPPNALYRGSARVMPGDGAAGSVTFGASATLTPSAA